jgi:small-conductance mechanosensitive channel
MRIRNGLCVLLLSLITPLLLPAADDPGDPAASSGAVPAGAAPTAALLAPVFEGADPGGLAAGGAESGAALPATPTSTTAPTAAPGTASPAAPAGQNPRPVIATMGDTTRNIENRISEGSGVMNYAQRIGIALGIIAAQALLIWLLWQFFKWFQKKMVLWGGRKIKPLTIKKLRLLTTKQIIDTMQFLLRILKYIVTIFQLFLTLPIVFSLFPLTKNLASTLFGYILTPLKNIALGALQFIPNLITIIIVLVVVRYVLRGLKFFATQIERERLVLPGFYADWAQPTFNILRVLLYAFTVAVIYPLLPGSGSPVFQGISVLVGVIFSLGSTSSIGNLIAGLVITYMRPFNIGDRIQVNNVTGFVVEKTLNVIRLKTHKNEYITFPNMMILGSSIINYHASSEENEDGLILYAAVTMGYAVPWRQVHEILITAALKTTHVLETPKPFVLQTALDDYYASYQINAYTKEVNRVPAIYSELYQNLQDGFVAAGIDLTAPSYQIRMLQEMPTKLPKPASGILPTS